MRNIRTLAALGAAIRGQRETLGWTQAALAERAGVSRATVIAVESGARFEVGTLLALARALDLTIDVEPVKGSGTETSDSRARVAADWLQATEEL